MSQYGDLCAIIVKKHMTVSEYQLEADTIRPSLSTVAKQYLGNDDEVEDVVQDVLLRLWDMHSDVRCPMASLARVLTRNRCIDLLRRNRFTTDMETVQLAIQPTPIDTNERIDRMMAIIDSLPALQQTILRLRHIDGIEMAQVAEIMGMTEVAVRKALSRARMAVREIYSRRYE